MKTFRKLVFGFVLVVGLGLTASAQRPDDQKKPPPKNPNETPRVEPREKPPRQNPPPPREDKPKKPGYEYSAVWRPKYTGLG